jgi:hypothetical protein
MYLDYESMANDPDMKELDSDYSSDQEEIISNMFGEYVEPHALAMAMFPNWDIMIVIRGNFDKTDVCSTLREDGFIAGEYQGTEIWTDGSQAVAFLNDMIFSGSADYVKASIRVSQGEEASFYDYEAVKSVSDKLPQGIRTEVYYGENSGIGEALSGGIVLSNLAHGDSVADITCWFIFRDEAQAEAALQSLEGQIIEYYNTTNVESWLRECFIEIHAEVDILDMFGN